MTARFYIKLGLLIVVVLVGAALAFGIAMHLTEGQLFETLGIVRHQRTTQSELLFQEARDIFDLVTAEYVVKSVFPHDFIPSGYSLSRILRRVRNSSAPPAEILTRQELAYLELHNLGIEAGIPIRPDSPTFLVLTAVLSAGYDVSRPPFSSPASPGQLEDVVRIGDDGDSVWMVVPDPAILEIKLEDPTPGSYQYPDIAISPAQMRSIAKFVRSELRYHPKVQTLLTAADQNGRRFLQHSLQAAGYRNIYLLSQQELDGGTP